LGSIWVQFPAVVFVSNQSISIYLRSKAMSKKTTKTTKTVKKMTVTQLMVALKKSKDASEKKRIRANLRKLGHKGGLNLRKTKKTKKAKAKKSKKVA